jgi:hypothetical protein
MYELYKQRLHLNYNLSSCHFNYVTIFFKENIRFFSFSFTSMCIFLFIDIVAFHFASFINKLDIFMMG